MTKIEGKTAKSFDKEKNEVLIIHNWTHVILTFYFNENGLNGKRDKWPDWGPIKNLGPNPEFLTPPLSANIDNSLKPRLPSQQTP